VQKRSLLPSGGWGTFVPYVFCFFSPKWLKHNLSPSPPRTAMKTFFPPSFPFYTFPCGETAVFPPFFFREISTLLFSATFPGSKAPFFLNSVFNGFLFSFPWPPPFPFWGFGATHLSSSPFPRPLVDNPLSPFFCRPPGKFSLFFPLNNLASNFFI